MILLSVHAVIGAFSLSWIHCAAAARTSGCCLMELRRSFFITGSSGGMSDCMPGCLLCLWHCLFQCCLGWCHGGSVLPLPLQEEEYWALCCLNLTWRGISGDESCRMEQMEPWRQCSAGVTGRVAWSSGVGQWRWRGGQSRMQSHQLCQSPAAVHTTVLWGMSKVSSVPSEGGVGTDTQQH